MIPICTLVYRDCTESRVVFHISTHVADVDVSTGYADVMKLFRDFTRVQLVSPSSPFCRVRLWRNRCIGVAYRLLLGTVATHVQTIFVVIILRAIVMNKKLYLRLPRVVVVLYERYDAICFPSFRFLSGQTFSVYKFLECLRCNTFLSCIPRTTLL